MRKDVPVNKDKAIFRRTAEKTKDINLGRFTPRGGIRF